MNFPPIIIIKKKTNVTELRNIYLLIKLYIIDTFPFLFSTLFKGIFTY